ncbi:MAG: hypothetical protein OEW16_10935, partial [Gammaproteobacteria bacterium]|nr:hypothetical protein [Gammaproteobacteria bacterium]
VTPFGFAPPDFVGRTVVDVRDLRAELGIGWGVGGTSAPFTSMGDAGLVLNPATVGLGLRHHIRIGFRVIDLTGLASPVTVAPAMGRRLFALGEPGHVELFRDWAAFVARLTEKLNGGAKAQAMFAHGAYDAGSFTITANHVAIALKMP